MEDQAFLVLSREQLDAGYTPRQWLNKRAKTIATLMDKSSCEDMTGSARDRFVGLVRGFVVVELLSERGPLPSLEWFQEKSKIRANSKVWLQSSREEQRRRLARNRTS